MANNEQVLKQARFDPKVQTYIFFIVLFYLIVSIIGWIVVPFWLLGLGQWLSKKFYHTLKCELTTKNLRFSKGIVIHIEKTIPLENIQDLSFYGGALLQYFGLTLIRIETAGGGGKHVYNMMTLPGVEGAAIFKMEILEQREKIIKEKYSRIAPATQSDSNSTSDDLLREIKYELIEIKNALKK